jgi:hypothetical protein
VPTLSWKQGTWDSERANNFFIRFPIASFPFPGKRGHLLLWPIFPARAQLFAEFESDFVESVRDLKGHGLKPCRRSIRMNAALAAEGILPQGLKADSFAVLVGAA